MNDSVESPGWTRGVVFGVGGCVRVDHERVHTNAMTANKDTVDRSGAVCYGSVCSNTPTWRVKWSGGERWYGICEDCANDIPVYRGQVVEGLTPETITEHPVTSK